MERVFFILPLVFGLVLLSYTSTMALSVRNILASASAQAQAQAKANSPSHEIEKACANAPYKAQCIDTLKAQPDSQNADLKTLAFISLNLTKAYTEKIVKEINKNLKAQEIGPNMEQGLTDCADQYTDSLTQIDQAMDAFFNPKGSKDVHTFLSTALFNAITCEEDLKDEDIGDFMANKNRVFSQYVSNALAAYTAMQKQM